MTIQPLGHILVVDDVHDNRDLLMRRLKRQGHTVGSAENGRQALEVLQSEKFDLVLLDIMMPEMNGYEVLERMKSDIELRHIPVVVISAVDQIESIVKCIEMGADDYLSKPFDAVLLKARVHGCLEKKYLRDQEMDYLRQIEREKKRADDLLHVILPDSVAEELKATNNVKPQRYDNVAVVFADVVGFTEYCSSREPNEILSDLQEMVSVFEELTDRHELQKIKTIGDCLMATAGLLTYVEKPVEATVNCGLDLISRTRSLAGAWDLRVGIHFGSVIAGIVGHRQFQFDIWGDTVNTAARIEVNGRVGAVNLSSEAWNQIPGLFEALSSEHVPIKGKGEMEIFHVFPPRAP